MHVCFQWPILEHSLHDHHLQMMPCQTCQSWPASLEGSHLHRKLAKCTLLVCLQEVQHSHMVATNAQGDFIYFCLPTVVGMQLLNCVDVKFLLPFLPSIYCLKLVGQDLYCHILVTLFLHGTLQLCYQVIRRCLQGGRIVLQAAA